MLLQLIEFSSKSLNKLKYPRFIFNNDFMKNLPYLARFLISLLKIFKATSVSRILNKLQTMKLISGKIKQAIFYILLKRHFVSTLHSSNNILVSSHYLILSIHKMRNSFHLLTSQDIVKINEVIRTKLQNPLNSAIKWVFYLCRCLLFSLNHNIEIERDNG